MAIFKLRYRCILSKFYIKPQPSARVRESLKGCILSKFYIKPQLNMASAASNLGCILSKFYIKPQRWLSPLILTKGCILSKFYIKPQLSIFALDFLLVVSYRNSTSNHNASMLLCPAVLLYLIEILHQTTTIQKLLRKQARLYLIEILHQTTTAPHSVDAAECCILSKFYIKPQHDAPCAVVDGKLYLIEILHQTTT